MLDIPTPPQTNERKALQLDAQRHIISDVVDKIHPDWQEVVDAVKDSYIDTISNKSKEDPALQGMDVASIYIFGSIARGLAEKGKSDLDAHAFIKGAEGKLDKLWMRSAKKELAAKFPDCKKFDLSLIPYEKFLEPKEYFHAKFNIKTFGIRVYGEDLAQNIPQFKSEPETIKRLGRGLDKDIDAVLKDFDDYPDSESVIKGSCSWLMRRIVRAGFMLIADKENVFTIDLQPSYELFSKHYPQYEAEMKKALDWVENPTNDAGKIKKFLAVFGKWLQNSLKEKFPDEVEKSEEQTNQHPETSPHPHSHTSDTSSKA